MTHNNDTTSTTQVTPISNSHNLILSLSALSFFTGITSSAWYTHRKASEYLKETTTTTSQLNSSSRFKPYLFSLKALAVGSILCVSAGGLIAVGVSTLLGVHDIYEFHKKMEELIHPYTPGLRNAVRCPQEMEQKEIDDWKTLERAYEIEKNDYLVDREEKIKRWKNKKWW
ncbi:346_t:CDS:2 [Funneliformis geosporum]|uniref:18719_t:CDS:1 n=1 Tax=Funneliformis geosporum TaxID=1117311 RepID=A0A9W4SKW8_9GLOM|nr:346_t:CDS:2 [Funneliformis geosporum]CAI2172054.1 18719_t:CDS:2 [Funneliformis geosporum]